MTELLPRHDTETAVPAPAAADWLLTFTSTDPNASDGDGRPWGDGTSIAGRARNGLKPWDEGCQVQPFVGGDLYFSALCETFEKAIADAQSRRIPLHQSKGHVYITGLQLNALRDLSQRFAKQPWNPKESVAQDQTMIGFLLRMMAVGIDVRLLLWMPTTAQTNVFKSLSAEHWSIAAAIQDFDTEIRAPGAPAPGRGIVALDLRTAGPTAAALHQKLVVVRVGEVNVAYCGGIDLAFTRRDAGRMENLPTGFGDWQSGATTPRSQDGWPKQRLPGSLLDSSHDYPKGFPSWKLEDRYSEDLPENVYGKGSRFWHDHALELRGPIVTTLEQQFGERWNLDARIFKFDRSSAIGRDNQVQVTHPGPDGKMPPLPPAAATPPVGDATVQMWRTIPLRGEVTRGPLRRGEFTVMAGIAKAVAQAKELITIWDQYFWSEPLARLLAARLNAVATLRLVIVLPPYGTNQVSDELALRKAALQTLWKNLDPAARARVKVFGLWNRNKNVGIYVHAKTQTYDDQLLVCGSANMNRRSLECDAELDCAVLHQRAVRGHLWALHDCVMAQGGGALPAPAWQSFGAGWLAQYWASLTETPQGPGALVKDPFFQQTPGDPKTPNGVGMPSTRSNLPYTLFEPSSINTNIGDSISDGTPGDPKAKGRLDELTFLLERAHKGNDWPWRVPTPRW